LNIVGISDKKFKDLEMDEYQGYKVIKPSEIKNNNIDIVLFVMKEYKQLIPVLNSLGVSAKKKSLVKTSFRFAVKNEK
jgi:hypothetical protein